MVFCTQQIRRMLPVERWSKDDFESAVLNHCVKVIPARLGVAIVLYGLLHYWHPLLHTSSTYSRKMQDNVSCCRQWLVLGIDLGGFTRGSWS